MISQHLGRKLTKQSLEGFAYIGHLLPDMGKDFDFSISQG